VAVLEDRPQVHFLKTTTFMPKGRERKPIKGLDAVKARIERDKAREQDGS
jgi:hypothetical protein